jgi:hypothetical protein
MARIRTIKPEFWDDDVIGTLSRDARLLFVATWNLADDEGLLRWTSVYLKSQAFMYDDDLTVEDVASLMGELAGADLVFPYQGGVTKQRLAFIVHFRRHQKVNRPQPSKLPPPSLQSRQVRLMYARRDGWQCHLCGNAINPERAEPSPDHLIPRAEGGGDHPSNIRTAHLSCNKGRGAKPLPEDGDGATEEDLDDDASHSLSDSLNDSLSGAVNASPEETAGQGPSDSLNGSVNGSRTEGGGLGRERKGGGNARDVHGAPATPRPAGQPSPEEPPLKCPEHEHIRRPPPCRACGDARREHDAWTRSLQVKPTPTVTPPCPRHPDQPAGRCRHCENAAVPPPSDLRNRRPRETA